MQEDLHTKGQAGKSPTQHHGKETTGRQAVIKDEKTAGQATVTFDVETARNVTVLGSKKAAIPNGEETSRRAATSKGEKEPTKEATDTAPNIQVQTPTAACNPLEPQETPTPATNKKPTPNLNKGSTKTSAPKHPTAARRPATTPTNKNAKVKAKPTKPRDTFIHKKKPLRNKSRPLRKPNRRSNRLPTFDTLQDRKHLLKIVCIRQYKEEQHPSSPYHTLTLLPLSPPLKSIGQHTIPDSIGLGRLELLIRNT